MKEFTFGKTKVKIYGGLNTIGGNCIVVESPSLNVMFDQGINFTQLKRFYGFSIEPDSVEELREMRVLPPREAYENVEEIYISHLHLDHLGSLNVPNEIPTFLPSRDIVEVLSRSWWFGWRQQLFPKTMSFLGFREILESKKVGHVTVSHSAYPSYIFLLETDDASILYASDLRINSPYANTNSSLEKLEELSQDGVDILIIEGTNFGRRMNYVEPKQFTKAIESLANNYDRNLLFISAHPLDYEALLASFEILWKHDYKTIFVNLYHAQLLDKIINMTKYEPETEIIFTPTTSKLRTLENFEITYIEDLKDEKKAIFIPTYAVKDVKRVAESFGEDTYGLLHVTILGEPLSEEMIIEEKKLFNWLALLGVTSYRIHLSGHYHPYEFKKILQAVKPKKLIPIHTKAPKTMIELFNKLVSSPT